jgi:glycosyltransferase involved in cell wall biosynthesis
MKTKKILHTFRNLKYGGNQALAYNIIKCSSKEYSHSILSFQDDLEMKSEFESLGCSIKVIDHKKDSFKEFKKEFEKFVRDSGFDTVVSWFYPYILRLEFDGLKFVHHIGTAPKFIPFMQWAKSLVLTNMYRKSEGHFIFASHHIQRQNHKVFGVIFKNSEVIYNGIDTSRFKLKSSYNHKDDFTITMVGRIDGSKDFDTLIRIALKLAKTIDNIKINIVGDGTDRARLEELAHTCEATSIVNFLGRRADVPDILHDSDLFVFLNRFLEGFGIALVEAMSCGLPVVTYNLGANSEIVDDGLDGFLVNTQDELIEKINLIANSEELSKKLGQNARKKVEEKFDVKVMVEEYEKKY